MSLSQYDYFHTYFRRAEIFSCVRSLDALKRLAAKANARYDAVRKAQKRQRKTGRTHDN